MSLAGSGYRACDYCGRLVKSSENNESHPCPSWWWAWGAPEEDVILFLSHGQDKEKWLQQELVKLGKLYCKKRDENYKLRQELNLL